MKKSLKNVTLLGVDCVDIERLKIASDICQKYFDFGAVKLLTSIPDSDSRIIPIDPLLSIEEYSKFCIRSMSDFVNTEFVLIIQYDGFILNPDAWTDEFLQYDYIGSPWWYMDDNNVGNGGFSLRSKKLLDILKNSDFITQFQPEDHHICRTYSQELKNLGITYAPQKLAEKFGIEGVGKRLSPNGPRFWTDQFGFHSFRHTDISKWIEQNPEYPSIKETFEIKFVDKIKQF
jgi:hypothetical protein